MTNVSPPPQRTARSAKARLERRNSFLRGAAEVFAEHGFRDTTMDMVAEKLGVAKVILYRHFASKEEMIHQILEGIANALVALDAIPEENYALRAQETLELARNDQAAFILLASHARRDPLFGGHYDRVHQSIAERLTKVFLGIDIEPTMSRISAEAITDLVINGALNWITYGTKSRDSDYADWLDRGMRSICKTWRERF